MATIITPPCAATREFRIAAQDACRAATHDRIVLRYHRLRLRPSARRASPDACKPVAKIEAVETSEWIT
jgi:hypothetical protein